MLAVHFGAGNIGRGFIGQVLHASGYKICFMDVNQTIINDINELGKYCIEIVGSEPRKIEINNIEAVNSNGEMSAISKIAQADIITTAVGPSVLKFIAPVIAKGILKRKMENKKPLNIIACENMLNASSNLKDLVYDCLDKEIMVYADANIGFPNAAVDRVVPIQHNLEKLLVKTEAFFEWDIESGKIVGDRPKLEGAVYVNNLNAYIERKLFSVNGTHASIAYLGALHGKKTIYEATQDADIMQTVRKVTKEVSWLLIKKYGFKADAFQKYIETVLARYSSPYISDEITRVGRAPIRKIGPSERLVSPAKQLTDMGYMPEALPKVIASVFLFENEKDKEAVELQNFVQKEGIEKAICKYCGLEDDEILTEKIIEFYEQLKM